MMHFMLYVLTFIALEVTNGRYLLVKVTDDTVPGHITDLSKISTSFRAAERLPWINVGSTRTLPWINVN